MATVDASANVQRAVVIAYGTMCAHGEIAPSRVRAVLALCKPQAYWLVKVSSCSSFSCLFQVAAVEFLANLRYSSINADDSTLIDDCLRAYVDLICDLDGRVRTAACQHLST
jgi:hypothetical protein